MNMKVKMKFGLESQTYAAPRAESVELTMDGGALLSASVPLETETETEDFTRVLLNDGI